MSELPDGVLEGTRVVEGSAFVAAPLGGMTLAQPGPDVHPLDPIGGGPSRQPWPIPRGRHPAPGRRGGRAAVGSRATPAPGSW